ncbi:hypothetical protein SLS53_006902 [Cytospora paraplurivora]|uniref:Rhodopsin domain-containing protein n=1 Tax=Cytospora paraplurivora TaxID=2898453 RepID=A0AAN9YEN0_9PEZI
MAVELDDFDPAQKRQYVLVGVTIGTVLAISSTLMRTWAKYISTSRIQAEDYFMGAALFLCIALASCLPSDVIPSTKLIFHHDYSVITTSIVRWVALLGTKSDITWNQVEAGVWTYLEISIGITCANLPLLLPLVRSWFSTGDTSRGYRGATDKRSSAYTPNNVATPRSTTKKRSIYTGFTTLDASNNATLLGSEVELRDQDNGDQERGRPVSGDSAGASSSGLGPEVVSDDIGLPENRQDRAIVVQTRVHIRYDEEDQRRIQEQRKHVALGGYGGDTKVYGTHSDGDDP